MQAELSTDTQVSGQLSEPLGGAGGIRDGRPQVLDAGFVAVFDPDYARAVHRSQAPEDLSHLQIRLIPSVKLCTMTYVAFLRGVNVGGKGIVSMAAVKEALVNLGLSDVRTYINSGNVIFSTQASSAARLTTRIEEALE